MARQSAECRTSSTSTIGAIVEMRGLFIMLLVAMLVLSVACGENSRSKQAVAEKQSELPPQSNISESEAEVSTVDDSVVSHYQKVSEKMLSNSSLRSSKPTLSPKELAPFLPSQILKAKRGNITEYRSQEGYASASSTYELNGNVCFDITLFDNGPDAPLFDKSFFEQLPQETNVKTVPIIKNDAIGYMLINDYSGHNLLNVLYKNRIYITIKTFRAADSEISLEKILNSLNIQSLLSKLN